MEEAPDRGLEEAKWLKEKLKIKGDLFVSTRKGKRFMIIVKGDNGRNKKIHFGVWKPKLGTYFDYTYNTGYNVKGKSWKWWLDRRQAFYDRHSKIYLADGSKAIDNKMSPDYYALRILWN